MRLKRLVPFALALALLAGLAAPVQAASSPADAGWLPWKALSALADLLGLDRLLGASEKGPGMDPIGEPNDASTEDDPQLTTTETDDGEKGPGMDPIG